MIRIERCGRRLVAEIDVDEPVVGPLAGRLAADEGYLRQRLFLLEQADPSSELAAKLQALVTETRKRIAKAKRRLRALLAAVPAVQITELPSIDRPSPSRPRRRESRSTCSPARSPVSATEEPPATSSAPSLRVLPGLGLPSYRDHILDAILAYARAHRGLVDVDDAERALEEALHYLDWRRNFAPTLGWFRLEEVPTEGAGDRS